ncbi:hypothetical protein [Streptomyces marincola]|uniref:Nucleotidyltransferase domain-containing protein n=1 Tax=Streptomyces marincola TaxID=2878388 RepID=A0A1W7D3I6_9ACTN|nr:hypothetical protein [Streptomyces marincola]ARQ71582.1 hypothetical protein CAG99_24595 [Streptomyces marincola]
MPYDISFDALLDRANADPAVLGVLLSGSRAHEGLATARSDHDLWVVTADGAQSPIRAWHGFRSARLDVVVLSLAEFRLRGLFADVERAARAGVHGGVRDAWGADLELTRP